MSCYCGCVWTEPKPQTSNCWGTRTRQTWGCLTCARPLMSPLLVAAGFTTSPNSYNLPRSCVTPPACLADLVLPWVATDLEMVEGINRMKNKNTQDVAVNNFLDCLMWLKIVYLLDMALLQGIYPNLPVFKAHLVFQHPEWADFSRQVKAAVDAHEANNI